LWQSNVKSSFYQPFIRYWHNFQQYTGSKQEGYAYELNIRLAWVTALKFMAHRLTNISIELIRDRGAYECRIISYCSTKMGVKTCLPLPQILALGSGRTPYSARISSGNAEYGVTSAQHFKFPEHESRFWATASVKIGRRTRIDFIVENGTDKFV
jgi:hypothetical protein